MKLSPPRFTPLLSAGVLLSLFGSTPAVTEATTDPVGFITMSVGGTSTSSPKLSLVSPTLTKPVAWQGGVVTISPTTITVSGTPWTANQFNGTNGSYYVEVYSATKPGAISDIVATGTNSITTSDSLAAFGATGDLIRIRKHVTISDLFGANNTFGLNGTDDPATADEVLVYSGSTSVSYFYYTGDPGNPAGWYKTYTGEPAGSETIGPNEGVIVKRKTAGNLSVTFAGAVKTGDTLFPIVNGLNVLATVSAKGLTLANSGLYNGSSGIHATDDPATADDVTIYTTTGKGTYFYYTGDPGNPAGWYDSFSGSPAGATPIPAGTSFVVNRKGGGAFNWTLPAPSSF